MKYGIVLYHNTDNLGDDILTYAAFRLIPRVDYLIEREEMDLFCPKEREKVAVIMNGWYLYHKYNWPPSPYIDPLFIGMHLSERDYLRIGYDYIQGQGKDYFIKYGPVGCRDSSTKKALELRGIDAYFSGCLTLTLEKFPEVVRNERIYLVDIPKEVELKITQDYVADFEIISHNLPLAERGLPWHERVERVEKRLRSYQAAACVVTSRLHVALPCLAIGTPVLLIYDEREEDRFSDYLPLLYYCTKEDFMAGNMKYDLLQPPENKAAYLEQRRRLIESCEAFAGLISIKEIDEEALPALKDFQDYWVEKAKWQKKLLADKRDRKELELIKERNWLLKQEETIRWLTDQNQSKDSKINEQEEHIFHLLEWVNSRNDAVNFLNKEAEAHKQYIIDLKEQVEERNNKLREITNIKLIKLILKITNKKF